MKLLTHNLLKSTVKHAKDGGYPLIIEATAVEVQPAEFNEEFTVSMLSRLNWEAFCKGAVQLGPQAGDVRLPSTVTEACLLLCFICLPYAIPPTTDIRSNRIFERMLTFSSTCIT